MNDEITGMDKAALWNTPTSDDVCLEFIIDLRIPEFDLRIFRTITLKTERKRIPSINLI